MLDIIPSINFETWEQTKEQILKIAPFSDWFELDIFDGKFAQRKTWDNPEDLKNLEAAQTLKFAVHFMIFHPEKILDSWIKAGIRRAIVQWEAVRPYGLAAFFSYAKTRKLVEQMNRLCKENWVEFGLSITAKTRVKEIIHFLPQLDLVQVLANVPGSPGREPDPQAFQLARELDSTRKTRGLNYKLEWDIGVNPNTLDAIRKTGVDLAASTSFIFNSAEPAQALEYLKKQARGLL